MIPLLLEEIPERVVCRAIAPGAVAHGIVACLYARRREDRPINTGAGARRGQREIVLADARNVRHLEFGDAVARYDTMYP